MVTITEDYVSFETAKLLKEKGFDIPCEWAYEPNSSSFAKSYYEPKNSELNEYEYSKPTHQMAMKWLREEYKIFIEIGVSIDINEVYHYSFCILDKICKYLKRGDKVFYRTYEEACEASIKYVLEKLI